MHFQRPESLEQPTLEGELVPPVRRFALLNLAASETPVATDAMALVNGPAVRRPGGQTLRLFEDARSTQTASCRTFGHAFEDALSTQTASCRTLGHAILVDSS